MTSKHKQRGLSFFGLIFWAALIASVGMVGVQIVPTVIEYQAIRKAAYKAAQEGSTVGEVRAVFDRAAAIDNISSVRGGDLDVTKEGEQIVVSYAYQREIHLTGPAYLVLKYQGRSN